MTDPRMSDPNLNMPIGGGTPPLGPGGPSLDDDEKALRKGGATTLIVGLVAALLVGGALVFLLVRQDTPDPYAETSRELSLIKHEHFDGFWGCALPNQPLANLRSDQDLRRAIHKRARTQPSRYAEHVRQQCLAKLTEHDGPLQRVIAPPDLQPQVTELGTALTDLRAGWTEYLGYLDRVESYDDEDAPIGKIAKGWYDYRRAHGAITTAARERQER